MGLVFGGGERGGEIGLWVRRRKVMPTSPTAQTTEFTRDVLGRYICNGLDEALRSTDKNALRPDGTPQSDARPFDIIVIGGGSFGPVVAAHLFARDKTHSHR